MAETIKLEKNFIPLVAPEIRVRTDPMGLDAFYFYVRTLTCQVTSITLKERMEGAIAIPLATIPITRSDTLQTLFNDLWQLGFRPADGTGNAGHLQAIQGHLEDMRKIAFRKLGIEK